MTINPYQAPSTAVLDQPGPRGSGQLYVQHGLVMAARKGAAFPDRCVTCNLPAHGFRLKQTVYWHAPWVYVFVLSPVLYVIVALLLRKSAVLHVGLCEDHRARRKRGRLIGVAAVALGLGGCGAGIANKDSPAFFLVGLAAFLGGLVASALLTRVVTAARIDQHEAHLKLGPPFVESLLP